MGNKIDAGAVQQRLLSAADKGREAGVIDQRTYERLTDGTVSKKDLFDAGKAFMFEQDHPPQQSVINGWGPVAEWKQWNNSRDAAEALRDAVKDKLATQGTVGTALEGKKDSIQDFIRVIGGLARNGGAAL